MAERAEVPASERDDIEALLADVLAQEVFIRSQGWSEWPTLDEIKADALAIVRAMGEATGWGGFAAWHAGTKATAVALLNEMEKNGAFDGR